MAAATHTNDQVLGLTGVTYGGSLTVTNLGGTLLPGDSFRLFATTNYSGSFTLLNLPPLPADLAWTNKLAVDGSLAVVIAAPPTLAWQKTPTNTLALSWPSYRTNFELQSQTNPLSCGLSTNWVAVPGATNSPVILPLGSTNPTVFFRLIQKP